MEDLEIRLLALQEHQRKIDAKNARLCRLCKEDQQKLRDIMAALRAQRRAEARFGKLTGEADDDDDD